MSEHGASRTIYFLIFAALLILTGITVAVAQVDFGWANDVVALTIATVKALLVLVFFMHLRHSTRATVLTAVAGFFFLAILLVFTLNDYMTRETLFPILGK